MRKHLLVVGLAGCWTSSPKPAREPKPVEGNASTGGASYAGIISLLGTTHVDSAFADLDGSNASGNTLSGQLSGVGPTDPSGGGGTGTGGAGGTGGTGRNGTIGLGAGTSPAGSKSGARGYSPGSRASAPPAVPTVSIGEPSGQSSALDPAIIRRFVRRNLPKIQSCYEQELLVQPGLEGRANIRFVVGAEGKVTQSTGSGMPPVDACVAGVIAAIEFPKPTGAGVVIVNYPFIFQEPKPDPDPNATP